jgi:hypothetical protein
VTRLRAFGTNVGRFPKQDPCALRLGSSRGWDERSGNTGREHPSHRGEEIAEGATWDDDMNARDRETSGKASPVTALKHGPSTREVRMDAYLRCLDQFLSVEASDERKLG